MKSNKLAIVGGLLVLLLVLVSIVAGCSSAGNKANPMEDISAGDKETDEYIKRGDKKDSGDILVISGKEFSPSDIPGYPERPPVENGIVHKVTSTALDLESPSGGRSIVTQSNSGNTDTPGAETKITQIIFNRDTKVYKQVLRIDAEPPMELKESSINDISEGQYISVWGEESGSDRVLATVIIIM